MMDSTSFNKLSQTLRHQDVGTMTKKKKEKENCNSISNDLVMDWNEKNPLIIISLITSQNNDPKRAEVSVSSEYVSITLPDGRCCATRLFAEVVPDWWEAQQKGNKFIVKLMKHDPEIHWPSLEPLPTGHTNKNHNNNNVNQNNNIYNMTHQHGNDSTSPTKLDISLPIQDKDLDKKDEALQDVWVIKMNEVKNTFTERAEENLIILYLYIKKINKETVKVMFSDDCVQAHFSTSDLKFLEGRPDSSESTVFQCNIPLLGQIKRDQCSFMATSTTLEIKMKKSKPGMWQAVSPVVKTGACTGAVGKIWENAGTTEGSRFTSTSLAATAATSTTTKAATIPPAPPAPLAQQTKKPTCLVSPSSNNRLDHNFSSSSAPYGSGAFAGSSSSSSSSGGSSSYGSPATVQGYMGLDNIGNTCFMNSVLQTLLNTRELRDYFLSPMQYINRELNTENPLGQGGRLAQAFTVLTKVAWSGNQRSFPPSKLKAVMSLKANQFSGFAQHDAQEFMVELLDGLHEDLNRVRKKPYIAEPPELDGWSDVDAAATSWRLHKTRNDSVIDDLFKGQFRSALTCHECNKISVKFDEFCCLSVPIPKDKKIVEVIFFYRDILLRPARVCLLINADAVLEDLLREVGRRVRVAPSCIAMLDVFKHKLHKVFQRGAALDSLSPSDVIMAFEVVTPAQVGGDDVLQLYVTQRLKTPTRPTKCSYCDKPGSNTVRIQRCTNCFTVGYCTPECQKSHWAQHQNQCRFMHEVVGAPFIVSLPKSHATYSTLTRYMEGYARHSVDIFQPPVQPQQPQQVVGAGKTCRPSPPKAVRERRRKGSTSSSEYSPDEEHEKMEVESECGRLSGCDETEEGFKGEEDDEDAFGPRPNTVNNDWGTGPLLETPPRCGTGATGGGVCAVPPLVPYPSAATQLFSICPVSSRGQNLPNAKLLQDTGDEPLELENHAFLAMDWKTNGTNSNDVMCLVKNKEVEYDDLEEGGGVPGPASLGRQHTTLEACMDLFTQPENLSEGDSWRCPRCKKPVEATKQMSLWKLPPVLIVQLKRFSFKYVLYSDKIDKFVKYPVRSFDVGPHIAPGGGDGLCTQYDLYGVVNHMGRLLGGHYTAYARLLDQDDTSRAEIDWRLFDDSRVSNVLEDRVVNDQAYLLLYRRRNTHFALPVMIGDPVEEKEEQPVAAGPTEGAATAVQVDSNVVVNADNNPATYKRNVVYQSGGGVTGVQSSVVHVPAAPHLLVNAGSAMQRPDTTDATSTAAPSGMVAAAASREYFYDGAASELPHITVHVGAQQVDMEPHGLSSNRSASLQNSPFDNMLAQSFSSFAPEKAYSGCTTSTINTNDAACGNLVSNIHIDGSGAVEGDITHKLPCYERQLDAELERKKAPLGIPNHSSRINTGFIASSGTQFAGTTAEESGMSDLPNQHLSAPGVGTRVCFEGASNYSNNAPNYAEAAAFVPNPGSPVFFSLNTSSSGTSPSDCHGAVLDDITPMSVSSTSQKSLSSTEEESISTAQDELD